jgi:hypothetical protein
MVSFSSIGEYLKDSKSAEVVTLGRLLAHGCRGDRALSKMY